MNSKEAEEILGINRKLNPVVILRAFRRMALRYHPDRYRTFAEKAWATRQFIKIKEARDLLLNGILSDHAIKDVLQEKNSSHEDADTSNSVPHSWLRSIPIIGWYLFLLERIERLAHLFCRILASVMFYIFFTVSFIQLFVYGCCVFILKAILTGCGIHGYPDSPTRKGRLVYLVIVTLPSIPLLPFRLLKSPWSFSIHGIVFGYSFFLFGPIFLFVLIEWVSCFLSEVWRRSIKSDLQWFSPAMER